MSKRRKFSSEFKHRVVIEALKERLTLSELGQKYDLHPNVITTWKREFLEKSKDVFEKPGKKRDHQIKEDELYKEIGKLKVENEFLKKNLDPYL
jgi:transposase-like protein